MVLRRARGRQRLRKGAADDEEGEGGGAGLWRAQTTGDREGRGRVVMGAGKSRGVAGHERRRKPRGGGTRATEKAEAGGTRDGKGRVWDRDNGGLEPSLVPSLSMPWKNGASRPAHSWEATASWRCPKRVEMLLCWRGRGLLGKLRLRVSDQGNS